MSLYTKDQLLAKTIGELQAIAEKLAVTPNETEDVDKDRIVYDILDAQAIKNISANDEQHDSDNYNDPEEISKVDTTIVEAPKRKRGRPSKAEIAAREAAAKMREAQIGSEQNEQVSQKGNEGDDNKLKAEKSPQKETPLPDFLLEQIEQQKKRNEEEGEHELVDFDVLQNALSEQVKFNNLGISPDEVATLKQALSENPSSDFVVLEDVPHVLTESDTDFDEEYDYGMPQMPRPRFRRFKDEMMQMQGQESNSPNEIFPEEIVNDFKSEEEEIADGPEIQTLPGRGVLEIVNEGHGFLRSADYNYLSSPDDIYVSSGQIYQYGLKMGDVIEGIVKIPNERETFFKLVDIEYINGRKPIEVRDRVPFEHLTPLFPEEKFTLCTGKDDSMSCRIVDLFAPIGKGQRALIVAQPKTGKTMLMKDIANAIARNHPDTYLMMLLIDERPEEVTDMARTVNAEVIASTFDESAARHVKIANIVLEKAKRMVESGHDVVIFLDSITRLARAYNTVAPASGKVLTGGVDANALQKPKRFFGAARNIEGAGSLTIIATALIDTGSKMDEVIFEEFKGTGNMELQLERSLANKRLFPAVNLVASSTRRDDLLLNENSLKRMWVLRNFIADMNPVEAITDVKKRLEDTQSNEEFLLSMNS